MQPRRLTSEHPILPERSLEVRPERSVLRELRWLYRVRWVAVGGLLASIPLLYLLTHLVAELPRSAPLMTAYIIKVPYLEIFLAALIVGSTNIVYGRVGERIQRPRTARRFAHLQLGADVIVMTGISHFLGSVETPVPLFVVFHVICATTVLGRRAGLAHAAYASAMIILLIHAEYYGWLPHRSMLVLLGTASSVWADGGYLVSFSVVTTALLLATAYLVGHLQGRVREEMEQRRGHVLELTSFYHTMRVIGEDPELDVALENVMKRYRQAYKLEGYALYLCGPGEPPHLHVQDGEVDPHWPDEPPAWTLVREGDDISMAAAPLRAAGHELGYLVVQKPSGQRFGEIELSLVEVVAANLALAALNANLYARVEEEATTDGLTGLVNHRQFYRQLCIELALGAEAEHPVSLILLDMDRFKAFNDTHGHVAGDALLRQVSGIIGANVRSGDIVARYGGEEFAVLLPRSDSATAARVADRVVAAVRGTRACGTPITISAGVGTIDSEAIVGLAGLGPSSLRAMASRFTERIDAALYEAKRGGRDQVVDVGEVDFEVTTGRMRDPTVGGGR